jgi:tetratricopeptide (TPR) repeat protein
MSTQAWILITVLAAGAGSSTTGNSTAAPPVPPGPPTETIESWAKGARLFDGLGSLHRPVTTKSKEAQAYFDQGLRFNFAFNHDEAARSFAKAAQLDPGCASCFWGVALTLGPNYNVPMLPDRAAVAWSALQSARKLAPAVQPIERELIEALAKRYQGPDPLPPPAMQPLTEAYATAMREVARKHPDDLDVQVLFAESAMDVNPWKLWTADGKPNQGTEEIVRTLEAVLSKDSMHPGANHYYVHAIEASPHPERALPSAERLHTLMPAAGHVVHMPAHVYERVGRYADASASNAAAIAADKAYLASTTPPGYYTMYLGHNYGFLAFSASMEGRSAASIQAAQAVAGAVPAELMEMMPGADFYIAQPYLAQVRFGRWDDLIAAPRPPEKFALMTAVWLHGRGMALVAKGELKDAQKAHAELVALGKNLPPDSVAGLNSGRDVTALAAKILEARLAQAKKDPQALALWAEAVKLQDGLSYSEPDDWFYPVRHFQGAALLQMKKPKEAEAVFREDLKRNPLNGWALYGLSQALAQQHKDKAAAEQKKEFDKAWGAADVVLTSSVL